MSSYETTQLSAPILETSTPMTQPAVHTLSSLPKHSRLVHLTSFCGGLAVSVAAIIYSKLSPIVWATGFVLGATNKILSLDWKFKLLEGSALAGAQYSLIPSWKSIPLLPFYIWANHGRLVGHNLVSLFVHKKSSATSSTWGEAIGDPDLKPFRITTTVVLTTIGATVTVIKSLSPLIFLAGAGLALTAGFCAKKQWHHSKALAHIALHGIPLLYLANLPSAISSMVAYYLGASAYQRILTFPPISTVPPTTSETN